LALAENMGVTLNSFHPLSYDGRSREAAAPRYAQDVSHEIKLAHDYYYSLTFQSAYLKAAPSFSEYFFASELSK
jgi:hypothetical protein